MTEAIAEKQTAELLQAVYKNVKMAEESLLNLMPKEDDEQLKSDMTVQLSVYEAFASRAAKHLAEEGIEPKEEGMLTKMSAKMGTMMNTMRDSTTSHLAEMIVEGSTMGVNDMIKQVRRGEESGVSESALRLAKDVLDYEKKNVEEMKKYLR